MNTKHWQLADHIPTDVNVLYNTNYPSLGYVNFLFCLKNSKFALKIKFLFNSYRNEFKVLSQITVCIVC